MFLQRLEMSITVSNYLLFLHENKILNSNSNFSSQSAVEYLCPGLLEGWSNKTIYCWCLSFVSPDENNVLSDCVVAWWSPSSLTMSMTAHNNGTGGLSTRPPWLCLPAGIDQSGFFAISPFFPERGDLLAGRGEIVLLCSLSKYYPGSLWGLASGGISRTLSWKYNCEIGWTKVVLISCKKIQM